MDIMLFGDNDCVPKASLKMGFFEALLDGRWGGVGEEQVAEADKTLTYSILDCEKG